MSNMILSTLTVYFLLLRIYPVIAVKDTNDQVFSENSYVNVIQDHRCLGDDLCQDATETRDYDASRSKSSNARNRLRGFPQERKNFAHAKNDQINTNKISAKRIMKGKCES